MSNGKGLTYENLLLIIRGVLFVIIGSLIFIPALRMLGLIVEGVNWPSTQGRIVSASLEHFWLSKGEDAMGQVYAPHFIYTYTVGGKTFYSDGWRLYPEWTLSKKRAQSQLAKFPVRSDVEVFYRPADPRWSVLDNMSVPPRECVNLTIGAILWFIGAATLINTFIRIVKYES